MKGAEYRRLWIVISTLIIVFLMPFVPLPIKGLTMQHKAMIGITIMALVFWATESIHMAATGLMIILLEVIYGILDLKSALAYIASDVNILILAGLVISIGLAKYNIDKYFSMKLVSLMGEDTSKIILGMMLATALLSMWIPNTAAAAIMAPVAVGMLELIGAKKGESRLGKAMMIGIAYAATIGGIGTPAGTPPVPITMGYLNRFVGYNVSFSQWMLWGVPIAIILTLIAWQLLLMFFRPEVKEIRGGREIVRQELEKLGKLGPAQKKVIFLFGLAAILWLLDAPLAVLGIKVENWTYIASIIIILLFVMPVIGSLSWDEVSREADWGVLFLVAGGLALGGGLRATGLLKIMAESVAYLLEGLPDIGVAIAIALITGFSITLFCSITATSSTMVPVAISVAQALGMDARFVGIIAGIASCFAFLLPANTPPNAIAYSFGYFKNYEMLKIGLVLTLISSLVLIVMMPYISLFLW